MFESSIRMISLTKTTDSVPPLAKALSIVVADDVMEIRQLIGQWMEEEGHAIIHASTGRDVLRVVQGKPCDLVITDILMPDGDGLDVIIGLKHSHPAVRILGVSGGGTHMAAMDALRLAQAIGADGMLLKPFTRQQLLDAVNRALVNQRR